jgi:hypothetical protein
VQLPEILVEFWRRSASAYFGEFQVLPPSRVLELNYFAEGGVMPVVECGSDHVALFTQPPIYPRIAYAPHDDGPRLLLRDCETLFQTLSKMPRRAVKAYDFYQFLQFIRSQYEPAGERTPDDQYDAMDLLATDGRNHEWNYAVQLLDETQLEYWQFLLETDEWRLNVRGDARGRMSQMHSPEIKALLQADRERFRSFVEEVLEVARAKGIAGPHRLYGDVLEIGNQSMILEKAYRARNKEKVIEELLRRFD